MRQNRRATRFGTTYGEDSVESLRAVDRCDLLDEGHAHAVGEPLAFAIQQQLEVVLAANGARLRLCSLQFLAGLRLRRRVVVAQAARATHTSARRLFEFDNGLQTGVAQRTSAERAAHLPPTTHSIDVCVSFW